MDREEKASSNAYEEPIMKHGIANLFLMFNGCSTETDIQ
jgi:hypothetical protein